MREQFEKAWAKVGTVWMDWAIMWGKMESILSRMNVDYDEDELVEFIEEKLDY
jgi:hypothetical protein